MAFEYVLPNENGFSNRLFNFVGERQESPISNRCSELYRYSGRVSGASESSFGFKNNCIELDSDSDSL